MRGQCLKALKPKKAMKAIGFGKSKKEKQDASKVKKKANNHDASNKNDT